MEDNNIVLTIRKLHAPGRQFHVVDESGSVLYYIKQKKFSSGRTLMVFDHQGIDLGIIKQCFALILPKYRIQIGRDESYIIKRKFSLVAKYAISDLPWVFECNDYTGTFVNVSDTDTRQLFAVHKLFKSWTDKYNIILHDTKYMLHSVLIAFALDSMANDIRK